MDLAKVSPSTPRQTKLKKVGALKLQRLECFLPIIGEPHFSKPHEDSVERPMNRGLAWRETPQRCTAGIVTMAGRFGEFDTWTWVLLQILI
jgi:hypothetical protein